jgi:aspartyl-tRNA(Asn)/glutamyl-tRNA(Gln) amidotransferase subunit C
MSTITKDDVLYTAALAKIALSDAEAESFTKELDAILAYVRQLDAIDTTGLQPTYQVTGSVNAMRDDIEVSYGTSPADLLKNAPDQQDGQVKVPRVL